MQTCPACPPAHWHLSSRTLWQVQRPGSQPQALWRMQPLNWRERRQWAPRFSSGAFPLPAPTAWLCAPSSSHPEGHPCLAPTQHNTQQ